MCEMVGCESVGRSLVWWTFGKGQGFSSWHGADLRPKLAPVRYDAFVFAWLKRIPVCKNLRTSVMMST